MNHKEDLRNLTPEEMIAFARKLGEKPFRGKQLNQWIFEKGATSFEEMTNLSLSLREKLVDSALIGSITAEKQELSVDGTRKYLFRLEDSNTIESVLIPDEERQTLCISTQAGCKLACRFCRTGDGGFRRNLTRGEILSQLLYVNSDLEPGKKVTNVVLMGMGEPLDNYDNVVSALRTLTSPRGMHMAPKRITLSTAGLAPAIRDFAKEDLRIKLAVSLNSADDKIRTAIMPINRRYPIVDLLSACRDYIAGGNKFVMFEYVMLGGLNDNLEEAGKLARLLKGFKCKINLIPFNSYEGSPYRSPSKEAVTAFHAFLLKKGFTALTRKSKGQDILAACGQLSWKKNREGESQSS